MASVNERAIDSPSPIPPVARSSSRWKGAKISA